MTGPTKLRAYLKRTRQTQEAFAAMAGVPGPQISLWLHGKRRPSLDSAYQLEEATGGAVPASAWRSRRSRTAA